MLTASDIAFFRKAQESLMPDTATITRYTEGARDVRGDRPVTWQVVATVPCRIADSALGGGLAEVVTAMETLSSQSRYDLTVPYDTDIQGKDRVTVNGTIFEVKATPAIVSYMSAKRVGLLRLEMSA
jgi:SPP1 family predicted phage head-tail adaptor